METPVTLQQLGVSSWKGPFIHLTRRERRLSLAGCLHKMIHGQDVPYYDIGKTQIREIGNGIWPIVLKYDRFLDSTPCDVPVKFLNHMMLLK